MWGKRRTEETPPLRLTSASVTGTVTEFRLVSKSPTNGFGRQLHRTIRLRRLCWIRLLQIKVIYRHWVNMALIGDSARRMRANELTTASKRHPNYSILDSCAPTYIGPLSLLKSRNSRIGMMAEAAGDREDSCG